MNVGKYAKTIVAALFAAVVVAKSAVTDGVYNPAEVIDTVLAVLTALGVWVVPNAKQSDLSQR
ncbi:hypothetical protein FHR32_005145 [Streptosporangium album]|uniref:Holin n=1 Tax=Streptosporangium album TaxID=47479 RepID=A0A7W7WBE2_9ACTN|nr:hypothetical protein [Streptosporangium album]MBB4940768.1 hypothetical protein [Streptosporangium album]